MAYSDPIRPINIQPSEEIDNLPDIDYYNIKKGAMVLRALNHKLRQQEFFFFVLHALSILNIQLRHITDSSVQ